jgi:hypothetical protein
VTSVVIDDDDGGLVGVDGIPSVLSTDALDDVVDDIGDATAADGIGAANTTATSPSLVVAGAGDGGAIKSGAPIEPGTGNSSGDHSNVLVPP